MTFEEFKKIVYYTKLKIVIPINGHIRVDKTNFMTKGKYDFKKQDEYLNQLYIKYNIKDQ